MRIIIFHFLALIVILINTSKITAQNTQYDTAKLNIGRGPLLNMGNQNAKNPDSINDNDGFAFTAGAAILYSFHPQIRDSLSKNGIFMPTFAMYFGRHSSPFIEISGARTKDNKGFDLELFQFSAGIVNQVELIKRLNLRQKFAMSALTIATGNPNLTKYFGVGFMAGLGLQTLVSDKLHLYLDVNYMYQAKQFSGIRFEPGIVMQF